MNYLGDMVSTYDLGKYIKFNQEVCHLNFDSSVGLWYIRTLAGCRYSCAFLQVCTGYYDQKEWHTPDILGLEEFRKNPQKQVVHSFDFNEKIPYEGLNVVVVGSGATAITIVPVIAKKTKSCTMLQRTPTYIGDRSRSGISYVVIPLIKAILLLQVVVSATIYYTAPWFIYKLILAVLFLLQIAILP